MTTLFIDWQPSIEAFTIGSFSVRWYSLLWCAGLLLAYLIVQRLYRQQKIEDEKFEPLFFYCFLGVLIGARLGHCIFYEPQYYLTSGTGFIEMAWRHHRSHHRDGALLEADETEALDRSGQCGHSGAGYSMLHPYGKLDEL